MDWNGDDKNDWQDDAHYLLVLDDESNNTDNDESYSNSNTPWVSLGIFVVLLVIYLIYTLIKN